MQEQKSKMEMNGVKKPNDFGSVQPTKIANRSVGYYKNQRIKLFNAIRRGYLGTRRVKFLKEIILMNQTMCDEIRESRSPLYLTYRLENELELDNLTKEGGYISNPFLLDQITEIIDEIAEELFHRDYRKKSENEMLIAMKEHWITRTDIHGKFMLNEVELRMLQVMNQQSLIQEHDPWRILNGYNYKSWRKYQEVKTRVICNTEFKENHDYKGWKYHDWRFDAICDMETPVKRLGKVKTKTTKYDHKGKEPNDRMNVKWLFLLVIASTLISNTANCFKIL